MIGDEAEQCGGASFPILDEKAFSQIRANLAGRALVVVSGGPVSVREVRSSPIHR